MRRFMMALCVFAFVTVALAAEKKPAPFKSVEAKHFTRAEGVELSPEFPDFLYAEMKTQLEKGGLFKEVIGEGEVVDPADAPLSMTVQGDILEFKKGSQVKERLVGWGAGMRSLTAHVKVTRRSDHQTMLDKEIKVRASSRMDEKALARALAERINSELKHELKS